MAHYLGRGPGHRQSDDPQHPLADARCRPYATGKLGGSTEGRGGRILLAEASGFRGERAVHAPTLHDCTAGTVVPAGPDDGGVGNARLKICCIFSDRMIREKPPSSISLPMGWGPTRRWFAFSAGFTVSSSFTASSIIQQRSTSICTIRISTSTAPSPFLRGHAEPSATSSIRRRISPATTDHVEFIFNHRLVSVVERMERLMSREHGPLTPGRIQGRAAPISTPA